MLPKIAAICATAALILFPQQPARGMAQSPSTPDPAEPAFEVSSVKLNASGTGPQFSRPMPGGQFTAVNMPLSDLVRFAYGYLGVDFRVVGIPNWARTTRYDVTAKMPASRVAQDGSFAIEDMRAMVRSLLRERFQLAAHRESRELPTYALVKARDDGRLGPRLRPSGAACPPIEIPAGIPAPPPPPPGPAPGGEPADPNCTGFSIPGFISARRTPLSRLAAMLSIFVERLVSDRTGLDGNFDVDMNYLPDPAIAAQGVRGRAPGAPPPPGVDPNAAELFTALQEQLGLKLESTRAPVDVVVVDRLAPASDN